MKRVSLLALTAATWLSGFSNLTAFDRTAGNYFSNSFANSHTVLAQNQSPPSPHRLDISGAAKKLGVTEAELIKALGIPPRPPRRDM